MFTHVFADSCAFIASANQNVIARYVMDSKTGLLNPVNGDIDAHGVAPEFVTAYNDNKNLLTVNKTSNTLSLFKVDTQSCNLTFVATVATGVEPSRAVQVGQYLYVANSASNSISQFRVNSDGVLTKLNPAELALTNFVNPTGIKSDPSGKYLVLVSKTLNKAMTLSVDSKSGQSSIVVGSLIVTGNFPKTPKFDKYNHIIIPAANDNKLFIYNFNINTGILSLHQSISSYGAIPLSGSFIDDTTFCLSNLGTNALSIYKYDGNNYVFEKNVMTLTQGGPPILQGGYLYLTGNNNQLMILQRMQNDTFNSLKIINTINNAYNIVFLAR